VSVPEILLCAEAIDTDEKLVNGVHQAVKDYCLML
jgi:hypothetical protein